MFTGVIHHLGTILERKEQGDVRLTVACDFMPESLEIGESIACNGACMTIVEIHKLAAGQCAFSIDISQESLSCTAPRWNVGSKLHLERSLKLGDPLDGHLVSGHVDGLAKIMDIKPENGSHRMTLEAPPALAKFIAAKGSVTLDGVSLTVNEVEGNIFSVNIIPHTWKVTTFNARKPGDALNLEIDMIARYVARLLP